MDIVLSGRRGEGGLEILVLAGRPLRMAPKCQLKRQRLYHFEIHLEQRVNHFIVKAKTRS